MRHRPERLLDAVPLVFAVYVVVQVLYAWALRWTHPFDLEWMEGGMLAHAWRLQHFEGLYVDPGPDFIPMIYPPGYHALVALLGFVTGVGYPLARGLSILGTLLSAAALMVLVGRQGRDWPLGFFGAAVFLGCYHASGAFYDLVRPDALQQAFLAWSVVLSLENRRGTAATAGLLLALAFTFKHSAAIFGIPLALGIWARFGWRDALQFGLASALPGLAFFGFMQATTGGNFWTYLFEVPGSHPVVWDRGYAGVPRELSDILPVAMGTVTAGAALVVARAFPQVPASMTVGLPAFATVLGGWLGTHLPQVKGLPVASTTDTIVAYAAGAGSVVAILCGAVLYSGMGIAERAGWEPQRSTTWQRGRSLWVFSAALLVVAVFTSMAMRAHHGGFTNVLMYSHWAIAAAFVGWLAWLRLVRPGVASSLVSVVLLSLQLAVQALDLRDRVPDLVPTPEDREAGERFVAALAPYDDPVLSPCAPWLPAAAGKRPSFHLIALWDIGQHRNGPFYQASQKIPEAARNNYWNSVVDCTSPLKFGISGGPNAAYKSAEVIQPQGRAFTAKTGWRNRPKAVLIPK